MEVRRTNTKEEMPLEGTKDWQRIGDVRVR